MNVQGHIYTKFCAVVALMRGRRGQARILWRWMANRPTESDLEKARERIRRSPEIMATIAELNRGEAQRHHRVIEK